MKKKNNNTRPVHEINNLIATRSKIKRACGHTL